MVLSQEWFDTHVKDNPNLSYTVQGGGNRDDGCPAQKNKGQETAEKPKPRNKYGAKRVFVYESGVALNNGTATDCGQIIEIYDSEKEYQRWLDLNLMQKAGKISELRRQVPLIIQGKFQYEGKTVRPIIYVADFMYLKDGKTIVEDVKGFDAKTGKFRETEAFRIKWKLLKVKYPLYHFEIF